MRILLLNQFFVPDTAATGQLLADVANALVAKGHEVHVVCSAGRYAGGKCLNKGGVASENGPHAGSARPIHQTGKDSEFARVFEREANRGVHFDQRRDFASACPQEHGRPGVRNGTLDQPAVLRPARRSMRRCIRIRAACDNEAGRAGSRESSPPKCTPLLHRKDPTAPTRLPPRSDLLLQ